MKKKNIAVIGGGASGIAAAIKAAGNGHDVTIYEHTDSLAKKLLITGNGKCNFSNRDTGTGHYHSLTDKGQTAGVFSRFSPEFTTGFLEDLGLFIKEKEGRLYPLTDSSKTVLNLLKLELKRLDVKVMLKSRVTKLDPAGAVNGKKYDTVIAAAGGKSFAKTGSDGSGFELLRSLGIKITEPLPALVPVPVVEDVSALKGVRCRAGLKLFIDGIYTASSQGELQPYEKGLSGICAMDVSGEAARAVFNGKKAEIECDYFPDLSEEELSEYFGDISGKFPARSLKEISGGLFCDKLLNYLIHPVDTRNKDCLEVFINRIKHSRYTVDKRITGDFTYAQVTSGGVSFDEINEDLSLKKYPAIRVCGELLDIYGDCGGYNLQWALSSGFAAGDIK